MSALVRMMKIAKIGMMMGTSTTTKCIRRNCTRKAGATPDLCYPCLKQIATEWFLFNSNRTDGRLDIPEIRDYFVKTYINKLQKRIKAARKNHVQNKIKTPDEINKDIVEYLQHRGLNEEQIAEYLKRIEQERIEVQKRTAERERKRSIGLLPKVPNPYWSKDPLEGNPEAQEARDEYYKEIWSKKED